MLLTGTFVRVVDEKLRVAIPKSLREARGSAGPLYAAPGTDRSLALYAEDAFSALAQRLAAVSPTGPDVRAFTRLFYARAEQLEFDQQGRIRIPVELG